MDISQGQIINVVGYARISSDSQIDNTSISEQKRRIQAQCDAKGWNLIEIFVDEGYSGSTTDRPAYQEMLKYLEEHQNIIQGVMVWKMDRAHRNQLNLLKFIREQLEELSINFISISESFDTSTPIGRMMLGILATFGEFERETISERTQNGRKAQAKDNKYVGGAMPYGYKLDRGQIRVEEEQAAIVKEVFELYLDGKSYNKIATILTSRGIATQKGGKWSAQHIKKMVSNESYAGCNMFDGIKQKDVFERIISRQMWNKVQALIEA